MLRLFSFFCVSAASFAVGFVLVWGLAGGAKLVGGAGQKLVFDRFQQQVSTRARRGPALARRDRYAAASKGDREPLFQPHIARRPDLAPLPPLPPLFQGPDGLKRTKLVALNSAPFPYKGITPRSGKPFLNYRKGGKVGHRTGFGRLYWQDKTYSDNRVLLHVPENFDKNRPGVMVVFFHGHGATLTRDVLKRQQVPAQISASGMNAVLVAPQLAHNARDSSAGKLWTRGGTKKMLDEAAINLAELYGDPSAAGTFANMPVILVGYSGGYVPTAWSLARGGLGARVKGVVLLDGLYGEIGKFAHWIGKKNDGFFVSAFTGSTKWRNVSLKRTLTKRKIPYATHMAARLAPGSATIIEVNKRHRHYVTRAWANYPIADILNRLPSSVDVARIALPATIAAAAR